MLVHAYKCPGEFTQGKICFSLKSFDEKEIPDGWFTNLADAVEDAGLKAFAPEKKGKKKRDEKRDLKMMGNPYVAPSKQEPKEVIEPEPEPKKEEVEVKSDPRSKLTDDDKLDILELTHQKFPAKEIAEKYEVSVDTVYRVLKSFK